MRLCIPPELFNAIPMPASGNTSTNISTLVKGEMSYRLPSVSDVMMQKETWHVICNFCERVGGLVEKLTGNVSTSSSGLTITAPTYGKFQRLVGAGVDGEACSIEKVSLQETSTGPKFSFDATLLTSTNKTGYLLYTVVPDIDKAPSSQNLPLWFINKYSKVFVSGGLFRILSMQGRPWTDITTARLFAVEYNNEIERVSRSLITSGMRKYIRIGTEDLLVSTAEQSRPQSAVS